MNARYLLIGWSLFSFFLAQAQQRAQYTQYILNNYLLNPAAGGVNDYWDIKMGLRNQWTSFKGAPLTYFASANGPIGFPHKKVRGHSVKPHHGVGGYVFRDESGPISMTGMYGSYSYHLKPSQKLTVSMGASVGMFQYQIRANELFFVQSPDDPLVANNKLSYMTPDASLGLWTYGDRFYAGVSANQLFRQNLKFNVSNSDFGQLRYHYYLTGGYRFSFSREWDFIPSIMMKYVYQTPLQIDLNARIKYNKMAWLGISYRRQDAMAVLIGVLLNERFEIGYSYDLITSRIRTVSWGSHEIIFGMNLKRRNQVLCPNDFWN